MSSIRHGRGRSISSGDLASSGCAPLTSSLMKRPVSRIRTSASGKAILSKPAAIAASSAMPSLSSRAGAPSTSSALDAFIALNPSWTMSSEMSAAAQRVGPPKAQAETDDARQCRPRRSSSWPCSSRRRCGAICLAAVRQRQFAVADEDRRESANRDCAPSISQPSQIDWPNSSIVPSVTCSGLSRVMPISNSISAPIANRAGRGDEKAQAVGAPHAERKAGRMVVRSIRAVRRRARRSAGRAPAGPRPRSRSSLPGSDPIARPMRITTEADQKMSSIRGA